MREKYQSARGILLFGLTVTDREDTESYKMACPKCGSTDVRRSRSEGIVAFLFSMFGRWPYRCRSCRVKFYHVPPEEA